MDALTLLSGDAQAFTDKIWASRVHLHHTEAQSLVGLLTLDDVDHLLTSAALRTPTLRVVQDGAVLPASRFTRSATLAGQPLSGLVDGRKVLALFDAGATVVLQGLHRYWPPLTELVRGLELALGHPCQANAYLTPPGAQGFARHSDTHDVFVFQTHGCKRWEIVDGGEEREVVLEPGLSMYLPTGTAHSARSEEATSLHVTVGVNQVTVRQALRRLSDRLLADERYDEVLPAAHLDDPAALAATLGRAVTSYAEALGEVDAAQLASDRVAAFLSARTPALGGGLRDLVELRSLDDETVLERRPTAACALRVEGERLVVLLGDRTLRMPRRLLDVMEHVRDQPRLRVGDLEPWLDPESRLVVARRLVREGLLRFAHDHPSAGST
jgi:bifunctional lysine-specific demethylase and histidyl-hydroxylase NO66